MKNSTLLGSAASVLLLFSAISYSRTYIQQQDPKPQQPTQPANPQANSSSATEARDNQALPPVVAEAVKPAPVTSIAEAPVETVALAAETYTATAYSLRGRTASGKPVARGLIAADPRVLPLGTRVRIDAGTFSGEYLVADTGGGVKGRRIDIWTETTREAMRFGRRAVKLTVLEFGGKRARKPLTRPRLVNPAPATLSVTEQSATPKN